MGVYSSSFSSSWGAFATVRGVRYRSGRSLPFGAFACVAGCIAGCVVIYDASLHLGAVLRGGIYNSPGVYSGEPRSPISGGVVQEKSKFFE